MSSKVWSHVLIGLLWLGAVGALGWRTWKYETAYASTPGRVVGQDVARVSQGFEKDKPTLVIAVHPQCPCTRATISELERAVPPFRDKIHIKALFYRPGSVPAGWEQTGMWFRLKQLPNCDVVADVNGREAKKLGLAISGELLLINVKGKAIFHGGITETRGHEGDNPGADALVEALSTGKTKLPHPPVFGCSLFADLTDPNRGSG